MGIQLDKDIKAQLVYCMDFIMHHLNDEEAIVPWLALGCPDGLYDPDKAPPAAAYKEEDISDETFEEFVVLFTRILAREVMPGLPALNEFKPEKGVLW